MKETLDLLIIRGLMITFGAKHEEPLVQGDTAIAIRGDTIVDIGPTALLQLKYSPVKVLDASDHIVLPGLVNAHTHSADYVVRGLGTGKDLWEWLSGLMFPAWACVDPEDAYIATLTACLENIKMGNTTIAIHYYGMDRLKKKNFDRVLQAVQESGVRTILIRGFWDKKGTSYLQPHTIESKEEVLSHYEQLLRDWHFKGEGLIQVWIGPISLRCATPDAVGILGTMAQQNGAGVHIHVSESKQSQAASVEEFGMGEIDMLARLGVLGKRLVAGHAVWISDREIDLLAETGSHVVYNPVSNMFLADGVAPIPKLLKAGVNVALGSDGPSCNNTADLFEAMKFGICLQKVSSFNTNVLDPARMLKMATVGGARSVQLDDTIGTLEVGKKADIILVGTKKSHVLPLLDPLAALVYSLKGHDVDTVIINGKEVMTDRTVKTIDEETVLDSISRQAPALLNRVQALMEAHH